MNGEEEEEHDEKKKQKYSSETKRLTLMNVTEQRLTVVIYPFIYYAFLASTIFPWIVIDE